ncbi:MAG: hypothetical protein M1828_007496 [Chrysothrix sp. TS-e1954]|nr:MAG: hypothetical protein M1828_007496 [Chrysothrix sp. TS-e1954]
MSARISLINILVRQIQQYGEEVVGTGHKIDDLESAINVDDGNLTVVYFDAKWHSTWKELDQKLEQIAGTYSARFCRVDVAEPMLEELATQMNVKVLPTFILFKGETVKRMQGPNVKKLDDMIVSLA